MKRLAVFGATLALSGCAQINHTMPEEKVIVKSHTYDLSFDDAWVRAVDWFADHNVTIEKIEKTSGLITAKYMIRDNDMNLDCGHFNVTGTTHGANISKSGSLNVTVRNRGENKSRVNVNFFGEYQLTANDAWDGRLIRSNGHCVSNGQMEKSILNYIAD
ncbi:copper chaperone PCu(A)C [Vibrio methylphosphonaticus]|uniref:hypothetical protein n=1 Tax=Vibrio methylphosphonaticus TaxID=2946866 RepID=UPI002029E245|nr:hypothetical protein [Vibrio methylphosphonaticus]MCL9777059.1 hypothetical protein [Vibrio methylphosphonaticus]